MAVRGQLTSPSRVRIRSLCALALAITIAFPMAVAAQPAPAIVTTAAPTPPPSRVLWILGAVSSVAVLLVAWKMALGRKVRARMVHGSARSLQTITRRLCRG